MNYGYLILGIAGGVILYFLIKYAFFNNSVGSSKAIDKKHEDIRKKWAEERKEKLKQEASGKAPTHIVEWKDEHFEVYHTKQGDLVRVDTGESLGGRWEGPKVIEILGMTEEQKKTKAEMLALFDKMVASDRVASTKVAMGMGATGPGLQTYLRYMEKGPLMHIWWYDLYIDYEKVCELTNDENDRMTEAIKNRTKKPVLDPKEIEELL